MSQTTFLVEGKADSCQFVTTTLILYLEAIDESSKGRRLQPLICPLVRFASRNAAVLRAKLGLGFRSGTDIFTRAQLDSVQKRFEGEPPCSSLFSDSRLRLWLS